jgi:nicotinamidase-related amidase
MKFSFYGALLSLATIVSTATADYNRLNWNDTAVLFIDHQTGLFNLVRDFQPDEYLNSVMGLAEATKYFNIPTVLTTSREDGPNGPLLPELKDLFPDAPYIARPGQINAWDHPDFVEAVRQTGKKQLVISGIVTDVCVSFVSLSAKAAGYEVFVITDASGTFNAPIREAAWSRMAQGGIQLMNWFAFACEVARDWRMDVNGLGAMFAKRIPSYAHVMDSFNGAQAAVGSTQ